MLCFINAQEIYFQKILFSKQIKKINRFQNANFKIISVDLNEVIFSEFFPNFFSSNLFNDFMVFKVKNFLTFFATLNPKEKKENLNKLLKIAKIAKNHIIVIAEKKIKKNSILSSWIKKEKITNLIEPESNFETLKKFILAFINNYKIKLSNQRQIISFLTSQLPLDFSFTYTQLNKLKIISKNWDLNFLNSNLSCAFKTQIFNLTNAIFNVKNANYFFSILSKFDFSNKDEKINFVFNFFSYLTILEMILAYQKLNNYNKSKIIKTIAQNQKMSLFMVKNSYTILERNRFTIKKLKIIFSKMWNYINEISQISQFSNYKNEQYYSVFLKFKIIEVFNYINSFNN